MAWFAEACVSPHHTLAASISSQSIHATSHADTQHLFSPLYLIHTPSLFTHSCSTKFGSPWWLVLHYTITFVHHVTVCTFFACTVQTSKKRRQNNGLSFATQNVFSFPLEIHLPVVVESSELQLAMACVHYSKSSCARLIFAWFARQHNSIFI